MDELARQMGFLDFKEMSSLIAHVDISTPERLAAFNLWKQSDGSKYGLLCLYASIGQEPPRPYSK